MSHSYPSDISREQFARILPTLESARRRTKPRTVDLYDVFCGVLYLLKSGCQWRMLPADFPNWRTCYKYFRQWSERPGPGQDSIPLLAATPASQPWLFPLLMSKIYRDYRSSMSLVPRSAAATRSVDSRLDIHIFQ